MADKAIAAQRKTRPDGPVLIFPLADGSGEISLAFDTEAKTVWATQKEISEIFGTSRRNVSKHLNKIFLDGELDQASVSNQKFQTASDGKRYKILHYNLKVLIAVANKVDSPAAVKFRAQVNDLVERHILSVSGLEAAPEAVLTAGPRRPARDLEEIPRMPRGSGVLKGRAFMYFDLQETNTGEFFQPVSLRGLQTPAIVWLDMREHGTRHPNDLVDSIIGRLNRGVTILVAFRNWAQAEEWREIFDVESSDYPSRFEKQVVWLILDERDAIRHMQDQKHQRIPERRPCFLCQ